LGIDTSHDGASIMEIQETIAPSMIVFEEKRGVEE
jgi:hypothetical protein